METKIPYHVCPTCHKAWVHNSCKLGEKGYNPTPAVGPACDLCNPWQGRGHEGFKYIYIHDGSEPKVDGAW